MLSKVSIKIYPDGYTVLAQAEEGLLPDASKGSAVKSSKTGSNKQRLVPVNHQQWQLKSSPFSELVQGARWDELALSARYVEALERVSVASSKLARRLGERHYAPLSGISVTIEAGRIDVKLDRDRRLMGHTFKEERVHCRYEWDENRQLKPIKSLHGNLDALPKSFLIDFKEACFGRYGLLARLLERIQQEAPMVDHVSTKRRA